MNGSIDENAIVNYSSLDNVINCGELSLNWDWYQNHWYPYYQPYYVSYPIYISNKDKFEKAFKIAKSLLNKRLVSSRKLKDFIALVEEIAKEL